MAILPDAYSRLASREHSAQCLPDDKRSIGASCYDLELWQKGCVPEDLDLRTPRFGSAAPSDPETQDGTGG